MSGLRRSAAAVVVALAAATTAACSAGPPAGPAAAPGTATAPATAPAGAPEATTAAPAPAATTAPATTAAAGPATTAAPGSPAAEAPAPAADVAADVVPAAVTAPLDTTADLDTAVRWRSDAVLAGDAATALALVSARCAPVVDADDVRARAAEVGGVAQVVALDARVDGTSARVDYGYAVPGHDVAGERWTLESGQWRWDAC
ncbi:hypothetical protein [Kineococcus terrestris]|uniref:hypothetical protein n=1 Tax=Kineococcus terrestris TaxID=2044856 RepID=UPI0034DB55BC